MDFFIAAGAPMAFARQIPTYVALFSGGFAFLTRWCSPLCAVVNTVAFVIRKVRRRAAARRHPTGPRETCLARHAVPLQAPIVQTPWLPFRGGGLTPSSPWLTRHLSVARWSLQAVLSFMSFVMPVPTPSTAEAWSFKNATFPATYFALAATGMTQ
jgi:hypothetical protein